MGCGAPAARARCAREHCGCPVPVRAAVRRDRSWERRLLASVLRPLVKIGVIFFCRARRRRIANRSSDSERARPGSLCPHEHAHEISRPLVGGSPQFSRQNHMGKATRKPTAKKTPPSEKAMRLKKDAARAKAAADPFATPGSARATLRGGRVAGLGSQRGLDGSRPW